MTISSSRLARLVSLAMLGAVVVSGSAFAQTVEFTPFVGARFGGEFERSINDFDTFDLGFELDDSESYGFILGFNVSRRWQIELLYSTQETTLFDRFLPRGEQALFDLDADYLHAGFAYQFATSGRVRPFVAASAGMTRLLPEDPFFDDDEQFSFSIGGGVKLMLADHVGLRFEGRGFWTLLDDDEALFCDAFDLCFDANVTDTLTQGELRAGLLFTF